MPPKNKRSEIPAPPSPPPELSTIHKEGLSLPDLPEEPSPVSSELPQIEQSTSPEFDPMPMEQEYNIEDSELEPAPAPEAEPVRFQQPQMQQPRFLQSISGRGEIERIEEIAESIIQEKWDDVLRNIGDISLWKENVKTELTSIKQEVIRTQERFENLQKAVLGKVKDYDSSVRDLGSEMRALQKVFEKILNPLSTNIKELDRITRELKGHKK